MKRNRMKWLELPRNDLPRPLRRFRIPANLSGPLERVDLKQSDYEDAIDFCHCAFAITGNGAFLWRAYSHAREGHVEVPEQVLRYLDLCALAVEAGGRDSEITSKMMLRHRKGGAGTSKHTRDSELQMAILWSLLAEYRDVRTGLIHTKREARQRVARRFSTTEGRIHQLELKAGL